MKQILGVRFSEHGQVLACVHDVAGDEPGVPVGHGVMADLEYGRSYGTVVWQRFVNDGEELDLEQFAAPQPQHVSQGGEVRSETLRLLPEVRPATEEERRQAESNTEMCREARSYCRGRIAERELDMKLVDVEILYDRSKMIFYFTAPTRIDFRELVKDLVRQYRTRIELRQIGVRHETQMLGALGNCGMVCCCRRYLRKFAPVTIKMAKEQNLFLNPAKISGICGRLLCCLSFEQENYDAFHHGCPKLGKRYQTTRGPMRVLRGNMFRNSIMVLPDGGQETEYTLDEWRDMQPHRAESQPTPPRDPRHHAHFMVVRASPDTLDNDLAALEAESMATEDEGRPRPQQAHNPEHKSKRRRRKGQGGQEAQGTPGSSRENE